ncbi:MAG: response regulator transcription factor [Candidatus Erginobacter occultus]|nr:response regulator transcription factor [Candidatus Erginobacter occultus]
MRILLVEDDPEIARFVLRGLKRETFAVDHAKNGEDGLHLALTENYDAAVVDIMLPRLDGISLIRKLREAGRNTPVIILSAKRSTEEKVEGLRSGSDDYLGKPFSFTELLARIQALIRRATGTPETTCLRVGDLHMDLLKREVTRSGRSIVLQPREFAFLEYLMRNAGRVVSKTMIIEHVWDYNFEPQTNIVEVSVSRLRNKIDRDFDKPMIHTIRGAGYVVKESV